MLTVLLAWTFEAFAFMLFSMLALPIMRSLGLTPIEYGAVMSTALLGTVAGGIIIGMLADKVGRVKALALALLIYSAAAASMLAANSYAHLLLAAALIGFGLGSEWSTGMTLISETVPPDRRGLAVGIVQSGWPLGVLAAIADTALLYPLLGWRVAFAAAAIPALLVLAMTLRIEESQLWLNRRKEAPRIPLARLFTRGLLRNVAVALAIDVLAMFSYWLFWSWVPVFLATEKGLTVVKSAEWLSTTQVGAWIGYITYGYLQDRLGRRPAWTLFLSTEATMIIIYTLYPASPQLLLPIGFLLGYFTGYWSGFGALLSELFPTEIRSTALGFIFNTGRGINFASPLIVAYLSQLYGWATALSTAALAAYTAAGLVWLFPETRGRVLD